MHEAEINWGLILAGGAGRRVGGADKGLLPGPDGAPLVANVARQLRPQVGQLFISCNRNPARYAVYADTLLSDRLPDFAGPLAGLASFPWQDHHGLLLLCPCDTPCLPADLGAALARPLQRNPRLQLSYAVVGDQPHYLHALLRTQALATLADFLAEGGRAVRHWYATLACAPVAFAEAEGAFANWNKWPAGSSRAGD